MAKANSTPWYVHVLKKDENVIVKALEVEVRSSRGRPKQTWKKLELNIASDIRKLRENI